MSKSAQADDDGVEEEGEDSGEIETAYDDDEERLKGLVWGLKVEEDAKEKAAKELRLSRAELAKRKENRGEGHSGPALVSILGASGKVDVERAQAVLNRRKNGEEGRGSQQRRDCLP